jgi:Bacterial PH domain
MTLPRYTGSAIILSPSPRTVGKYLSPHEEGVIVLRQHPAVLIPSIARALGGLLVASAMQAVVLRNNEVLVNLVWLLWALLLLRLLLNAARWSVNYFVVTSERLLLVSGLSRRKVKGVQLTKVTDISFERSFAGQLFGYGELSVESTSQHQELQRVDFLPYPEQLYLEIYSLVHPANEGEPPPAIRT